MRNQCTEKARVAVMKGKGKEVDTPMQMEGILFINNIPISVVYDT